MQRSGVWFSAHTHNDLRLRLQRVRRPLGLCGHALRCSLHMMSLAPSDLPSLPPPLPAFFSVGSRIQCLTPARQALNHRAVPSVPGCLKPIKQFDLGKSQKMLPSWYSAFCQDTALPFRFSCGQAGKQFLGLYAELPEPFDLPRALWS